MDIPSLIQSILQRKPIAPIPQSDVLDTPGKLYAQGVNDNYRAALQRGAQIQNTQPNTMSIQGAIGNLTKGIGQEAGNDFQAITNAIGQFVGQPDKQAQAEKNPFGNFTTTPVPTNYQGLIAQSARQAGVDPNVLASLLFTEHGFQATGNSEANSDGSYDRGIAQINNKAHPEITDEQANDPNFAIPWAAHTLAAHIKNMGDYAHGIAAYNVGEGGASNSKVFNGAGMTYVNKVAKGLTPQLAKSLGISQK